MTEQTVSLRDCQQIIELLAILEQNGLHREKEEVSSLVGYIGDMEEKLSMMMAELQEMHGQVQKIHDKTLSAHCAHLLSAAREKLTQAAAMVSAAKSNVIRAAENAVMVFKDKGRAALKQAARAMKIPDALAHLRNGFSRAAEAVCGAAGKAEARREQLHEAGGYLKNAGRVVLNRETKEPLPLEEGKGALARVSALLGRMGLSFSAMAERADGLLHKLAPEIAPEGKKPSVKQELQLLKAEHRGQGHAPAISEPTR